MKHIAVLVGAVLAIVLATGPVGLAGKGGKGGGKPGGGGDGGSPAVRIAYTQQTDDLSANVYEVFVADADGSGATQLTSGGNQYDSAPVTWSPDGRYLAARDSGGVRVIDVSDGSSLALPFTEFAASNHPKPSWSARLDAAGDLVIAEDQLLLCAFGSQSSGQLQSRNLYLGVPDGSTGWAALTNHTIVDDGTTVDRKEAFDGLWLSESVGTPDEAWIVYAYLHETGSYLGDGSFSGWTTVTDELRVMHLDTSAWPEVSVLSDSSLAFHGAPQGPFGTQRVPYFSGDGSTAGWLEDGEIHLASVSYASGLPTIDVAGATVVPVSLKRGGTIYALGGLGLTGDLISFTASTSGYLYAYTDRADGGALTKVSGNARGDDAFGWGVEPMAGG